ncbi:hypothetical protein [Frisingicoccus sp.]|uniref:hypothetical protein n=1 Tax=Frisingicoccus sp. TaxID=1918627 RepID=UPI003AB5BFD1
MNEEIAALFHIDWNTFIFAVCAILSAWMAVSKAIDFLIEKTGIETKMSLRRKKMEKSISEINEIKESVNEVKELMTRHIEKDKERTVVTLRSNIWQMHGEFMKQGFVTKDGLEVFSEACKLYENDGGNGVVKQKIEPEVMRLPVK